MGKRQDPIPVEAHVVTVGSIGRYPSMAQAKEAIMATIRRSGREIDYGWMIDGGGRRVEVRPRSRMRRN